MFTDKVQQQPAETPEHAPAITTTKTGHPADGSPRWIVSGPAGSVVYDVLGNHLALLFTDGEIDSMGSCCARTAARAAADGDDEHMFELLTHHYRVQLAGGAR